MGNKGVSALLDSVRPLAVFSALHIGGNRIGDTGALRIADHLKTDPPLTELDIRYNKVRGQVDGLKRWTVRSNSSGLIRLVWRGWRMFAVRLRRTRGMIAHDTARLHASFVCSGLCAFVGGAGCTSSPWLATASERRLLFESLTCCSQHERS